MYMNIIRSKIVIMVAVFMMGGLLIASGVGSTAVFAGSQVDNISGGITVTDPSPTSTTIPAVIGNVIRVFSIVIGVASVIMIMVGGLKYITASGDASSITSAKNTILYALVGLVVAALAQVIVRFVLDETVG